MIIYILWESNRTGGFPLQRIVKSTAAKSLVRLVSVKVAGCRAMTDMVIGDEEEDGAPNLNSKREIVFGKLKSV